MSCALMLFRGYRIVGAALDGGGVGDDDTCLRICALARRTQSRTRSRPALPDGAVSGVEGLPARGICVVLRRLATVVFPVVAYDPYSPDPCLVIRRGSVLVGLCCSGVLPGYEQNEVAGRKYGIEDVPG